MWWAEARNVAKRPTELRAAPQQRVIPPLSAGNEKSYSKPKPFL